MRNQKAPPISESERKAMMEAFVARGGTIKQCPPGPSEDIVYKNSYGKRSGGRKAAAKPAEEAATEAAPAAAPAAETGGES
ncbi:MAG TPA: hypothetical protein VEH84_08395 [Alphaproteobacteria bacterium]|nr:hypothetical protein [Alphaproteobacteria bacterium]